MSCMACGANTCSAGACTSAGLLPTGAACTNVSQCAGQDDIVIRLKTCESPTLSDGGASGWVQGYCSASCLSLFTTLMCPSSLDYCNGFNCLQGCSNPGGGQGSCRVNYVCLNSRSSDGGIEPASAHCVPNCNNAPAAVCGTKACLISGSCAP